MILLHDTANAQVRAGLAAAELVGHPKVRMLDLAFVELQRPAAVLMEEWGALGLIVVGPDDGTPPRAAQPHAAAVRGAAGERTGAGGDPARPRRGPPTLAPVARDGAAVACRVARADGHADALRAGGELDRARARGLELRACGARGGP